MVPDEFTGGPRFAAFCERYIRQTKGRWGRGGGQPLLLEDWQREFWWEALEVDPTTGLRVYQEVGQGLPRKNGKSTQTSAAGYYFAVADDENEPEVYVAAPSRTQAGIIFNQQRSMGLRSPRLLDHVIVRRSQIEVPKNGGIIRAISSIGNLQHGFSPSANLVDELWAHRDGELYTALTTGTGAREQPITLWISTGGPYEVGILPDLYRSMVDGPGELEDRGPLRIYRDRVNGVLIYWWGAPANADIEDPRVWLDCNPASWLQDGAWLRKQFGRLKSRNALREWSIFHLNQFAGTEESWLPDGLWDSCAGAVTLDPRQPVYAVVRVSHDHRSGAVAAAQKQGDMVVLEVRCFPDAPLDDGDVLDLATIEGHLLELRRRYPARILAPRRYDPRSPIHHVMSPGPEISYTGAFFQGSAQRLRAKGLVMLDVPDSAERRTPAAQQLMGMLLDRKLVHDAGAETARHVAALVGKPTDRGQRVGAPASSQHPVVGGLAAMSAAARADSAPTPPSRLMRSL